MKSPLADETSDLLAQARGGDIAAFSLLMEMERPAVAALPLLVLEGLILERKMESGRWFLAVSTG